jgi:hypothetical protein
MTANKVYYPAFIGGRILGAQLTIQNATASDITASSTNGIYYTFEGSDYQLLSLGNVTIHAGETVILNEEFREYMRPNSDIKIMVDSGGLAGCILKPAILWGVGDV